MSNTRDIEGSEWLQTVTGRPFFLFDPEPCDFDIEIMAHALSMQCRFAGHTTRFYSVAEHSVMVSNLLADMGATLEVQKIGLLHDGAEAYLGDCIRPLKRRLDKYRECERRIETAMSRRFGLPTEWPSIVKAADMLALAIERRDVMAPSPRPWRDLPEILDECTAKVIGYPPDEARQRFMWRWDEINQRLARDTTGEQAVIDHKQG